MQMSWWKLQSGEQSLTLVGPPSFYAIDRKLSGIETLTVRSRKWV
jgi:hypothetical protein